MSEIKPVRIQRKRTRGFNLQAASSNGLPVVCVSRGTTWGNPFVAGIAGHEKAVALYRRWLDESLPGQEIKAAARIKLRGKNLACWCSLECACHADVLLELANMYLEKTK